MRAIPGPQADELRRIASELGITRVALAERIGVSRSHASVLLRKAGIDMPAVNKKSPAPRRAAEEYALDRVRKIPPAHGKQHRACITCGAGFWSQGPGNRMCDPCRLGPSEY